MAQIKGERRLSKISAIPIFIILAFLLAVLIVKPFDIAIYRLDWAIINGDLDRVQSMINERTDLVNSYDLFGFTPLHWAVRTRRKEIAFLLVNHWADPYQKDLFGKTPLGIAEKDVRGSEDKSMFYYTLQEQITQIERKQRAILKKTIQEGDFAKFKQNLIYGKELINYEPVDGDFDLLCWAAFKGRKDMCELLLARGADINRETKFGDTPLSLAVSSRHLQVVQLLIKSGGNVNSGDRTPLFMASYMGYPEIAELLLRSGAEANATSGDHLPADIDAIDGRVMPLTAAIVNGNLEVASILFRHHGQYNNKFTYYLQNPYDTEHGYFPNAKIIHIAAARTNPGILQLLLDQGERIDEETEFCFDRGGSICSKISTMEAAAIRRNGNNLLYIFKKSGLSERKINFATKEMGDSFIFNASILQYSIAMGDLEIVKIILGFGADVEDESSLTLWWAQGPQVEKWKPLDTAVYFTDQEKALPIIELCINYGASVNSKVVSKIAADFDGADPLLLAAMERFRPKTKIVKILLEKGANPNTSNRNGFTSLHYSAMNGDIEAAQLLIEHGAKINAEGLNGITPINIARAANQIKMCEFLIKNGAIAASLSKQGEDALHQMIDLGD